MLFSIIVKGFSLTILIIKDHALEMYVLTTITQLLLPINKVTVLQGVFFVFLSIF